MRKILTIAAWMACAAFAVQAQDGPYKLIKEIQIGGEGGWDYLSVDTAAKRLYVSHATKAVVVDLSKDAVMGEIPDTPGIHGVIAVPPDRIFTSNGRGNNASIVNAKTLQLISKVETQGNPDFIMYEPKQKEVYTMNGRGQSATVIEAATGKVVTTIPLGGKPEAAVTDVAAGRVYVNVEDKNSIAVIDLAKHEVVANWPIKKPNGDVVLSIVTSDPTAVRDELNLRSDQQVSVDQSPWTSATVETTSDALIEHGDEWHVHSFGRRKGVDGRPLALRASLAWLEPESLTFYQSTPPGLLELEVWISPAEGQ